MANSIDELMDKVQNDPLGLSNQDIDDLIAYERKQRGLFDSGVKPKKENGEKKELNVAGILAGITGKQAEEPPKPRIVRRI